MRSTLISVLLLSLVTACGAPGQGMPSGKVRVLNLFSPDGGAGPAIDVYAAPPKSSGSIDPRAEPLIAGLGYAQMSEYIAPLSNENVGVLSFLPAGTKTATAWYPGEPLPGTFKVNDQAVILVHNCPDATGAATVCYQTLFESGPTEQLNPLARPTAGQAMFYERTEALDSILPGKQYWWGLGGPCLTAQSNGSINGYQVPASASTLVLIMKAAGAGSPTCAEAPTLRLPLSPGAGQRSWLFLWGSSATDLHLNWVAIP